MSRHRAPTAGRPSSRVRLVVVDNHEIVRQGLVAILEREPDVEVVGEAASASAARAVVARQEPDLVLLDLKLSLDADADGLELCRELTARHPGLGVLVLTTFLDERLVMEAIRRGAKGYVLKDVDAVELVRGIRAVHRGESVFDTRSAAAMVRSVSAGGGAAAPSPLTRREGEIVRLVAHGLSNREIGERLYISETTVKFHVRNIMRKLGAGRRAEVVYAAGKLGVLEP
jgi:two-component system, NarL family, response regulator DevR